MPRKPISFELDFMIKDIFPRFTVKQFDDVSFNIKPLNQGLEYDTSNMIGKIYVGVNNDMFMQTTDITVSSDNINVLLDKNMLQKNGRAYAEIELTDEDGTITSSSFIFDIDPKIGEGGMIPGEYEGFVEKYERLISEFKAQINSSISNSNDLVDKTIKNCNTSIDNKLNTVDDRLNTKIREVNEKLDTVDTRFNSKASEVDSKLKSVDGIVNTKITNVNNTLNIKVTEVDNKLNTVDGLITAKVSDFEKRFNRLTSSQQQNSEVIDAREGEVSLKARLDKDIENPKKLYTSIEGTEISVDSLEGYLKDIEILGNTVQDQDNLADIRSVGDKLENQELYEIPVLITNGLDDSDSLYQEQQITILSPIQLEKVGDIADRIICKDGVWGVEKNVKDFIIPGGLNWVKYTISIPSGAIGGYIVVDLSDFNIIVKEKDYHAISDKNIILKGSSVATLSSIGIFLRPDSNNIYIKDYVSNLEEMKLKYEGSLIKYPTTQPQFIPLPHDQQVKLRTFANKTNISFGCEIEPTLKASVPKSLGASVSSNTEQIDILHRELDKIKKLLLQSEVVF